MTTEFASTAVEGDIRSGSVCRALMSAQWNSLAPAIRAVHERRPVTLVGRATVVRGWGLMSRLFGWASGLPPDQHNGPVRVLLENTHGARRERWTRYFGTAPPMRSSLRRAGDCVDETVGLTRLRFKFSLEGGSIRWTAIAGRTLGVSWPQSWLKGIDASESHRGNRYYFNVRAALPGIGLIVHYVGELDVVNA
ncbi:MAG: hypothetical protein QOK23_3496 [Gammaproteobacteria bacterium]|jgi:hypothetical protein|nr:hypothetical protein [Gammaproteobacteria bacterium]